MLCDKDDSQFTDCYSLVLVTALYKLYLKRNSDCWVLKVPLLLLFFHSQPMNFVHYYSIGSVLHASRIGYLILDFYMTMDHHVDGMPFLLQWFFFVILFDISHWRASFRQI